MGERAEKAWAKAAACAACAASSPDEVIRRKFEKLRDSWIRIANNAELSEITVQPGRRADQH
jgi:hypothetical protein